MLALRRLAGPACAATLLVLGMTGCGDDTKLPQTGAATPFTAGTVTVTQQGNADVSVDTSSVTFSLDGTRSLVMNVAVTSHAAQSITVSLRASLYDPKHNLVGDAVGGQVDVQPGQVVTVEMGGPTPLGTIASAVIEASAKTSTT